MPGRDTARIARELAEAGVAEDMPCCAISHAATLRQSVAVCRLEAFDKLQCGPAPLLLLIGRAMDPLLANTIIPEHVRAIVAEAAKELNA
jgi:uroporphyrin-III C-methyltransferase